MQLSFGMIFSILIIIVTVGVAFYVISEFMETGRCTELRAFHENLQREIDTTWRSASAQLTYNRALPSSVTSVCFGSIATLDKERHGVEAAAFQSYRDTDNNFFIHPVQCGRGVSVRQLSHVGVAKAFCVPVRDGKVKLALSKAASTSSEVTLSP